jgi:hypothetical protein
MAKSLKENFKTRSSADFSLKLFCHQIILPWFLGFKKRFHFEEAKRFSFALSLRLCAFACAFSCLQCKEKGL